MAEIQLDTSFLQDADQIAEAAARAGRAREEHARQSSPVTPLSKQKASIDDAASSLDKALVEVMPDAGVPAPREVTAAPDVPANPEKKSSEPEKPDALDDADGALDGALANVLAEQKPAEEKPAAEEVDPKEDIPAEPKSEDAYDKHQLAPTASKRTSETFDNLKREAREREAAAKREAEEARAEVARVKAELEEAKAKEGKLTPELEQELKELREHRALFATEHDPAFRQRYDGKINQHYEGIFKVLAQHKLPDAVIAELRTFSREEKDANIERYLGMIDNPTSKRLIEGKLAAIALADEERAAELSEAKSRAEVVLKSQREAPKVERQKTIQAIVQEIEPVYAQLDFLQDKKVEAATPPELRKTLEAHNQWAAQLRGQLKAAIEGDDVKTRALAAVSVPLAQHFARENKALKEQLAAANAKLERISKASATSRLSERASVSRPAAAPRKPNLSEDAGDALDNILAEVQSSQK